MSDTAQGQIDLDTLTDDEVMNLSSDQIQALMDRENQEGVVVDDQQAPEIPTESEGSVEGSDDPSGSDGEAGDQSDDDGAAAGDDEPQSGVQDPNAGEATGDEPQGDDAPQGDGEQPQGEKEGEAGAAKDGNDPSKAEKKDEPKDDGKSGERLTPETQAAVDFHKRLTAPFKADGRDFQVRSPEDAIRLMQMGVNYSRRMQEMKPLKAMDAMLREHGLNDPQKLSFLIDVAKGEPNAIQKLLKEKGIDPIDIDTSKDSTYQGRNYAPDDRDIAFKEAIESTLQADGGRELISEINSNWDNLSKEALRDQPVIFENILAQKQSGVYGKVKAELDYQRTMGYLRDVPFLQAYHQVSDAMQKAGVFGSTQEVQSGGQAPAIQQDPAPIDTGTRKAAQSPKTEQPNPNLSSTTPPRAAPSSGGQRQEPDYSSMSDEEFLKLGQP
jgi:hypothetical protein